MSNLTDTDIYDLIQKYAIEDQVIIGVDAPLSYQFGGGDRPADKSLRNKIQNIGMKHSSVMAPTSPRMSFLTLRGINLSRGICNTANAHKIGIVEVHPGATIGLHYGYPTVPQQVLDYKEVNSITSRNVIITWLENVMFLKGIKAKTVAGSISSHEIDACAAALAAWKWKDNKSIWSYQSSGIDHPFDFSC